MIVVEKGKYFSALTKQRYFRFDTEQIGAEIINLQGTDNTLAKTRNISRNGKAMSLLHG